MPQCTVMRLRRSFAFCSNAHRRNLLVVNSVASSYEHFQIMDRLGME